VNITFKPTGPSRAGDGGYATFVQSHRVAADQERRRSGAAGPHADRRTRRQRDRGAQRRAAVAEARA
jgi:hypothetical protein